MNTLNIYLLKKNSAHSFISYIQKQYIEKKQNNKRLPYTKDNKAYSGELFSFNLNQNFPYPGQIYILKQAVNPDWMNILSALSQKELSATSIIYNAILLINIDNTYYAISYNNGKKLLIPDFIEPNFGKNLTRKIISKNQINSIKTYNLFETPILNKKITSLRDYMQTDQQITSVSPSLIEAIGGHGLIRFKNLNDECLEIKIKTSGTDSVIINGLFDMPNDLVPIIKSLHNYWNSDTSTLSWENEITKINNPNPSNKKLVEFLEKLTQKKQISSGNLKFLSITYPLKSAGNSLRISVVTPPNKRFSEIIQEDHLGAIVNYLKIKSVDPEDYLKKINSLQIIEYDSDDKELKRSPVSKYLQYEYTENEEKYLLFENNWYKLSTNYTTQLISKVNNLKSYHSKYFPIYDEKRALKYTLKSQPDKTKFTENNYNEIVYQDNPEEFVWLDKKTFKPQNTDLNKNGSIEISDLVSYSKESDTLNLYCLKRGTSGSSFSHLIAQARNSVSYYASPDKDFKKYLLAQIKKSGITNKPQNLNNTKVKIILGIITDRSKDLSNSKLFPILSIASLISLKEEFETKNISLKLLRIQAKKD